MRVKLNPRAPKKANRYLTPGRVYEVYGIEADDYRIMDDEEEPVLFPPRWFLIVDRHRPPDWTYERGQDGELYAGPPEFNKPGFYEAWHDGVKTARSAFARYLLRHARQLRSRR